jgi:hypothetical protein
MQTFPQTNTNIEISCARMVLAIQVHQLDKNMVESAIILKLLASVDA